MPPNFITFYHPKNCRNQAHANHLAQLKYRSVRFGLFYCLVIFTLLYFTFSIKNRQESKHVEAYVKINLLHNKQYLSCLLRYC